MTNKHDAELARQLYSAPAKTEVPKHILADLIGRLIIVTTVDGEVYSGTLIAANSDSVEIVGGGQIRQILLADIEVVEL